MMALGSTCRLLLLAWLALLICALTCPRGADAPPGGRGLLIIVSFPNLAYDVALLADEEDEIAALVPIGADPHDYQLTPSDIRLLERADLIVSTAHAPFEAEMRKLVEEGHVRGVLLELPRLPGLRLLVNPATGQPNYHMPIYDPVNYERFVDYLSTVLAHLRPGKADEYAENARRVKESVRELLEKAPRLGLVAVADLPVVQYAVSWLDVEIISFVLKEPGVPATPGDLMELEEALANHEVDLVIVCRPTVVSASEELNALAKRYGLPIIYVPSPMEPGSILDKLSIVVDQALKLAKGEPGGPQRGPLGEAILILLSSILVASTLMAVEIYARD